MAGLQFTISELIRESQALREIAIDYLDPNFTWSIHKFESDIKSIWDAEERKFNLELKPLHTIPTEINGQKIYAICTGIWDVTPIGNPNSNYPNRKIEFSGIASTKIELFKKNDRNTPISMWRLELGTHNSPGCYFHSQILGQSTEPPFPKSVPIPRLPSLFITPMAAIEYVIGELFQENWKKTVASGSGNAPYWRKLQQCRLKILLSWYQDLLTNTDTSPWMIIKTSKPENDMFLS